MTAATRIARVTLSFFIFIISFTRDNLNHVMFKIKGKFLFVTKLSQWIEPVFFWMDIVVE